MSTPQPLTDSLKYRTWKSAMDAHGIQVLSMEELSTVRKPNGEVLFSMIRMDARTAEGQKLLPVALLRGHFVGVITEIVRRDTGESWFLLVAQRRVANGAVFYEHPAGMMDEDGDPWAVALKELHEETGVAATREDLFLLYPEPLYSSPGLLDEGGWFFGARLEMNAEEVEDLRDRLMGEAHEGESIRTVLAARDEAYQMIRNTSGLLHIFLYEQFKR